MKELLFSLTMMMSHEMRLQMTESVFVLFHNFTT